MPAGVGAGESGSKNAAGLAAPGRPGNKTPGVATPCLPLPQPCPATNGSCGIRAGVNLVCARGWIRTNIALGVAALEAAAFTVSPRGPSWGWAELRALRRALMLSQDLGRIPACWPPTPIRV